VTRVGVVTFPGSLDDRDALRAVRSMVGEAVSLWHGDRDLHGVDAVILPGGFSYGDYLRTGAIARFSPVMESVLNFADRGGPVIGIRNEQLKFVCRIVHVQVETSASVLTAACTVGDVLEIPVKHGEGQFVATPDELRRIEDDGLVLFRYCSPDGELGEEWNPNGATDHIAGLRSERGNVCGLMPHPEHAVDPDVGPIGGQPLFGSLLSQALATLPA